MSTKEHLIIKQMEIGPMENFVYFIGDRESSQVAVVDPGWDIPLIRQEAEEDDLTITCVLLTHGHYDHCDGVHDLLKILDVPVYLSAKESRLYTPKCANLRLTKDHDKIRVGELSIECLHTPGHTPGCQCFYVPGHLLTGDTLFVHGCGRCDLPGGDASAIYESLYNVIGKLPESTIIYPGHRYGPKPTASLKELKKTNPYLMCAGKDTFLTRRMGV